jgi:hypothetical protein
MGTGATSYRTIYIHSSYMPSEQLAAPSLYIIAIALLLSPAQSLKAPDAVGAFACVSAATPGLETSIWPRPERRTRGWFAGRRRGPPASRQENRNASAVQVVVRACSSGKTATRVWCRSWCAPRSRQQQQQATAAGNSSCCLGTRPALVSLCAVREGGRAI